MLVAVRLVGRPGALRRISWGDGDPDESYHIHRRRGCEAPRFRAVGLTVLESDRRRLVDALRFALDAHGAQTRKGTRIPYASHLLQVSGLVLEAGGDVTLAVAALLHDCLEDSDEVDEAALRERFGHEVAAIVATCTDLLPGDSAAAKSPWAQRKSRYLERLASADRRSRLVAACDKLQNLRALVGDLRAEGLATLERFSASPEQMRWYYESAHRILGDVLPPSVRAEFDEAIAALQRLVPRTEAP